MMNMANGGIKTTREKVRRFGIGDNKKQVQVNIIIDIELFMNT